MIVLSYYPSSIPVTRPIPYTCSYLFDGDYPLAENKLHYIEEFVALDEYETCVPVASYIRFPSRDLDDGIQNRYAYYTLYMVRYKPKNTKDALKYMASNVRLLLWMQERGISNERIACVEQHIWNAAPADLKERLCSYIQRFMNAWTVRAAEKYLAPDYVWRAPGPKCGRKTIDILNEKFLAHI